MADQKSDIEALAELVNYDGDLDKFAEIVNKLTPIIYGSARQDALKSLAENMEVSDIEGEPSEKLRDELAIRLLVKLVSSKTSIENIDKIIALSIKIANKFIEVKNASTNTPEMPA